MQEARNLKKLNHALHQQLETKDRQLEEYMKLTKTQAEQIKVLEKLVETQGILIEELQRIVFRKKKKKKDKDQNDGGNKPSKKPRKPREKANFQRPIPADVTETTILPLTGCR